jgi:protein-S-isoprenylcysteine O-methyltransferase Ste14
MHIVEPWNIVYAVGFVAFYRIRGIYINRTKAEAKIVNRLDAQEKALLIGMAPGTLVLPLLYLLTPWIDFAGYDLPPAVPWSGAALMALSLWLFWRSHADLGQNWSVTLQLREGHELVTRGVYQKIRHPMYAAIWLWAIAQGLMLENWLAGWSVVPAFAAMYWLRTPREEQLLLDQCGDAYREYMRKTGRLVPKRW